MNEQEYYKFKELYGKWTDEELITAALIERDHYREENIQIILQEVETRGLDFQDETLISDIKTKHTKVTETRKPKTIGLRKRISFILDFILFFIVIILIDKFVIEIINTLSWKLIPILLAYLTLFDALFGITIAKYLLDLKVINRNGKKINIFQALLRNIILFVEFSSGFIIGIIVALIFHKDLDDVICKTKTVSISQKNTQP